MTDSHVDLTTEMENCAVVRTTCDSVIIILWLAEGMNFCAPLDTRGTKSLTKDEHQALVRATHSNTASVNTW